MCLSVCLSVYVSSEGGVVVRSDVSVCLSVCLSLCLCLSVLFVL